MSWSTEYAKVALTGICPRCGGFNLVQHYLDSGSGAKVSALQIWRFNKSTVWQCTRCGARVPVIAGEPTAPAPPVVRVAGISELTRSEEPIGSDRRMIDNSASSVQVSRKFSLTKEWTRSYSIERETTRSDKVSLAASEAINLSWAAESAVKDRYSVTEGEKLTHQEEVTITVEAKTKVSIVFDWKVIWQHGVVRLIDSAEREVAVPFKVSQELTFDQTQSDEI